MNKISKTLTLTLLALLTAGSALASENTNFANISQAEVDGEVMNIAGIDQVGEHNYASIEIVGEDNQAIIIQGNLENKSVESPDEAGLILSSDNSAVLGQFGSNNVAGIEQYGSGNTASISQTGNMQTAMVTQMGTGNVSSITQK